MDGADGMDDPLARTEGGYGRHATSGCDDGPTADVLRLHRRVPSSGSMRLEFATMQPASTLQPAMRLTPMENGTSAIAISTAAARKGAPGR